jgi:hypothetical protein
MTSIARQSRGGICDVEHLRAAVTREAEMNRSSCVRSCVALLLRAALTALGAATLLALVHPLTAALVVLSLV